MPLTSFDQAQIIAAIRATAAREIRPRFRALVQGDIAEKANAQDLVTAADLGMEAGLRKAFAEGGRVIVIDPVDGTWNFAHDLASFGTLIAVVEDGETVFGVLYDPMIDDWVWAAKGEGCWFGTRKMSLPEAGEFSSLTALLASHGLTKEQWMGIADLYEHFGKVTNTGASVCDYRLISTGQAAFKLNRYCHVWDHAAGVLCVQEAGGHAALVDGTLYEPRMREGRLLVAQSERLWEELAVLFEPIVG